MSTRDSIDRTVSRALTVLFLTTVLAVACTALIAYWAGGDIGVILLASGAVAAFFVTVTAPFAKKIIRMRECLREDELLLDALRYRALTEGVWLPYTADLDSNGEREDALESVLRHAALVGAPVDADNLRWWGPR